MHNDNALSLICRAKQDLSKARTLSEVTEIRDKAEAVRNFMRQRGESLDAQNEAAEIKLWAERRAGELLAEMELNKGAPGSGSNQHEVRSHDVTAPTLSELGIARMQSHRWQRAAAIPEDVFVKHVTGIKEKGGDLTSAGIQALAKSMLKDNDIPEVTQATLAAAESLESMIEAGMKFGCIYADPPWRYSNTATRSNVESEYEGTMTVEEICALPIQQLAADNAHLHLWVDHTSIFE